MEAISVICEFERFNNYFTVGRNRSGEMIKLGNINAYVSFHEVVPPFLKSDTVMSTSDYHRRLDGNKYSDCSGNIQL